jgi:hypothetical protein
MSQILLPVCCHCLNYNLFRFSSNTYIDCTETGISYDKVGFRNVLSNVMNLIFFECASGPIRRFLHMFIWNSRKFQKLHYELHRKCLYINSLSHEITSQDHYVICIQARTSAHTQFSQHYHHVAFPENCITSNAGYIPQSRDIHIH